MISKGLEDVVVAETNISMVDGEQGRLIYRGVLADDLAEDSTFEEVAYLLLYGSLPNKSEKDLFGNSLASQRALPPYVKNIIDVLPADMDMMSVLRTAVSSIGQSQFNESLHMSHMISIIAKLPTIISYRYRTSNGEHPIDPNPMLGHTANYLYMLKGDIPSKVEVRALEAYFILTQDHGMNPSTFTARIVSSTRSDLISSITAAIGALKGPLHGGASSKITEMLESIGNKENADIWLRKAIEDGERLMGFGHRSYKTTDPRSIALRSIAIELSKDSKWMDLAVYVEEVILNLLKEYKPNRKLYTNVEFYTAAVMKAIGFNPDLYTPTFAISRVIGWCAHITEASEERLIYPKSVYKGTVNDL